MSLLRCKIGSTILSPILVGLGLSGFIGAAYVFMYLCGDLEIPENVRNIILLTLITVIIVVVTVQVWLWLYRHCNSYWEKQHLS